MSHPNNNYGFDAEIDVYDSAMNLLNRNDDYNTIAGAGGSVHGYDAFLQMDNMAAGQYYVRVDRYYQDSIPDDRQYTLQIQAEVAAVPEAETYAMLLAGLGLIGAAARRRKQK